MEGSQNPAHCSTVNTIKMLLSVYKHLKGTHIRHICPHPLPYYPSFLLTILESKWWKNPWEQMNPTVGNETSIKLLCQAHVSINITYDDPEIK